MNAPRGVWQFGNGRLSVRQGDITHSTAQAIVNAANPQLAGGGGVDGAIHKAAGPALLTAGRLWVQDNGLLPTGRAIITPGFNLQAKWVIHTVGPIWHGGNQNEEELLASAYAESMRLARENNIDCVDFPAISCGAYGFPLERAMPIALKTLAQSLSKGVVKAVSMVIFSPNAAAHWAETATELFGTPV
ncbi:macro domain-containing protein [Desulfovibrio ferrophilus]|uniref:Appr-1-p processing domain protein n=1 Tax=Desulfovibrio ferrophilus TaxID=241368 RepID=A0A2Z6AW74_9BACT|nr:macro domain-containing protein [Desulfovibrio ferrophilus]BBD07443.1 Appr-1-p processing domain protein [Desulfovibrio ferrophilus]